MFLSVPETLSIGLENLPDVVSVARCMDEKLKNFGSKKGSVLTNTASTFREKLPYNLTSKS